MFGCEFLPRGDVVALYGVLFARSDTRDDLFCIFQRIFESCDTILLSDDQHGLIAQFVLHLEVLVASCFHPCSFLRVVVLCQNSLDIKLVFFFFFFSFVAFLFYVLFLRFNELVNAFRLKVGIRSVYRR